jgi:hypothetical protein
MRSSPITRRPEAAILRRYAHACPRLAAARMLDTVRLARACLPGLPSYTLDALLEHLDIPIPAGRHRALAVGPEVLASQMALNYLHRHGDLMGKFVTWRGQGEVYEDVYRPADRDAVLAMAEQLDGPSGAALVDFWLRRQPESFRVCRQPGAEDPLAFVTWLELHEPDDEENRVDPFVASLGRMPTGPLRRGRERRSRYSASSTSAAGRPRRRRPPT